MGTSAFRFLRFALPLVLVCGFATAALADSFQDMRIVFDPISAANDPDAAVTTLYTPNQQVSVAWQSCGNKGIPTELSGYTACLALNNLTGQKITTLDLSFTTPSSFALQTIDCSNTDGFLTENNCPSGSVGANQFVSITLFGGDPVPNATDFFFAADAACKSGPCTLADFPIAGVDPDATPEPATLTLFLSGTLFILALGWWRLRRPRSTVS
jgi:hypothetical protein